MYYIDFTVEPNDEFFLEWSEFKHRHNITERVMKWPEFELIYRSGDYVILGDRGIYFVLEDLTRHPIVRFGEVDDALEFVKHREETRWGKNCFTFPVTCARYREVILKHQQVKQHQQKLGQFRRK